MKRVGLGCLVMLGAVVCLGILAEHWPSNARQALPDEATDVREYYWDDMPDFTLCLKAKVSDRGFQEFVRTMGLKRQYSAAEHQQFPLDWGHCPEPWWNPPRSLDGAFFNHVAGQESFELAKHEDGYLYYVVMSW